MAHSFDKTFMLALANPSIDISRMFNVQWYVVRRLEAMGCDGEDAEDVMAYNTCARIEMAKP